MTDKEELLYQCGQRQVWSLLLAQALRELGYADRDRHSWTIERGEAVWALRQLCSEYGDNGWNDDLGLSDVIEKHLRPHLEAFDIKNERNIFDWIRIAIPLNDHNREALDQERRPDESRTDAIFRLALAGRLQSIFVE